MKKIISLLLCSALAAGTLCFCVSAKSNENPYGEYGIMVGKTQVNAKNKDNILKDGTAKYDDKTNTLTLNNLNLKSKDCEIDESNTPTITESKIPQKPQLKDYTGIISDHDINIVLKGSNTIDFSDVKEAGQAFGILGEGKIEISGGGTLNIPAPKKSMLFFGIASEGTLDLKDLQKNNNFIGIKDSTINITADDVELGGDIYAYATDFSGKTDIKLKAGISSEEFYALFSEKINFTGGKLLITSKSNDINKSKLFYEYPYITDYGPYQIKYSKDFEGKDMNVTKDIKAINDDTFYSLRYFSLKPIVKIESVSIDKMKPAVGDTLTALPVPADSLVTYQWNIDKKPVKGETGKTYKVKTEDFGKTISVTVTGTENYIGTATSPETAKAAAPVLSGKFEFNKGEAPKDGLTFNFSADVSIIKSFEVNGKTIDASAYTLNTEKNTVTLNKAYLDKLDKGDFTLKAVISDNMKAEAKFTVTEEKKIANPKTGGTLPQGAVSLALLAGLFLTAALKKNYSKAK